MLLNYCELWEAGCCGYCCSLHRRCPGHGLGLVQERGVGMESWRCFHVTALDCCGLGLVPHVLVGPRVLFWRQVGGEGSAPEPHSAGWEVDVGILVCLLPALPTAVGCLFVA